MYSSGKLGDVGDGGRLRCLHYKVDTIISCTYVYMYCWLRPVFLVHGLYDPSAMAAI